MEEKKKIAIIGGSKEDALAKIAELGLGDDVEIVDVSNVTDFGKPMVEPYLITNPYPELYDMRAMMDDDWNRIPKSDRRGTVAKVRNSKEDPKIQRNDPCPCGSGKKYKKCCGHE